jgi:hypothetical protein
MVDPVNRRVSRGPVATTQVLSVLKIHPAIGIARFGNSKTEFFLGPEVPGRGPVGEQNGVGSEIDPAGPGGGFKAADGVKPQGQRFRIFQHGFGSDSSSVEVDLFFPKIKSIEWTVHLANKKAAFFKFNGQAGASADKVFSPAAGQTRRNAGKPPQIIDPGEIKISGRNATPIRITPALGGSWPKDAAGKPIIDDLGQLCTDDSGRLVVVGGSGQAKPFIPGAPLLDFANNDGWLDTACDGFVRAKVTIDGGITVEAEPAWILIGPPDFAPGIGNVLTLYDTLWDVAAQNASIPIPNNGMFFREPLDRLSQYRRGKSSYRPSMEGELRPMFSGCSIRNGSSIPAAR